MKALTNLQKFEFRGVPFSSWLFRIAKSELYQSFRDTKARRTVNIDTVFSAQIMEEFVEDYTDEQRAQLMSALHLLKPNQLQLIEMRYFEKQSFREIGNFLGITENNAKVKTFRTLLKLKTVFLNMKK
jgi:RNA polymerase sigma-70 factor (ECF subfamily)